MHSVIGINIYLFLGQAATGLCGPKNLSFSHLLIFLNIACHLIHNVVAKL